MTSVEKPSITEILRPLQAKSPSSVESTADGYLRYFEREQQSKDDKVDEEDLDAEATDRRRQDAVTVTNAYYDLATDFYEYGWGDAFHFAVLKPEESREHSFAKHEYFLAMKLGLKAGDTVLVSKTGVYMYILRCHVICSVWELSYGIRPHYVCLQLP